jgi:DNA repair protein RadD
VNLNFTLRPYQVAGVEALRAAYRRGRTAPVYTLPTGGGKTLVFSYITRGAVQRGKHVLILVHRAELLRQASDTLTRWGVAHGCISPRYPMTAQMVQVASVQTVVRRLHRITPPDLIIIDEAHHVVAGSWQKVVEAFPAARLLGVTATPARLDGRGLGRHCGGAFDELVVGPTIGELIADGFLVRPRVFASPRHLNLAGVRTRGGDYARDDIGRIMRQREIVGDAVDHYRRICAGTPAIAFCVDIEHAMLVTQQFNAAGLRARRIDGTMGDPERSAVVAALAEGDLDVMVSVDLVSEGFDVPACGAAILLRPTQSMTLFLQQVGRALRPAPGKTCAYILDHAGNVAVHGLPQDAREWTLDGRRLREGGPGVKQCPQCFAMQPNGARVCDECGYSFTDSGEGEGRARNEVDGQLIELTPEIIEAHRRQRASEVAAANTREELLRLARSRGYHPRWVDHVLAARRRRGAS